jgi:Contractile injection system tube protein/LysM domain
MAETDNVIRAELRELKSDGTETGYRVPVQFNPETLKVSFANQLEAKGDQGGTSTTQYVGKGTTKLSVQLWFDVTGPERQGQTPVKDVRDLTKQVVFFITPKEAPDDKTKVVPPGIRFLWGSFKFDGIMESLEESLEFFSPEGRPLRASVSLSLSQQKIEFLQNPISDPAGAGGTAPPGTKPLAEAAIGDTLQGLASGLGKAQDWQKIAAANGIENPRMLRPGQLINMNPLGKS